MDDDVVARDLDGSDLKWMREASKYLCDGNGTMREKATCHYAIPKAEHQSLVKRGLVASGTVLLTDLGVRVAAILRSDGADTPASDQSKDG